MGSTDNAAKGLGLGKAGDSLEEINSIEQSKLGNIDHKAGRLGLDKAGDSRIGDGRVSNGGRNNGRINTSGVCGGRGNDSKRNNIGALKENSPSGLV